MFALWLLHYDLFSLCYTLFHCKMHICIYNMSTCAVWSPLYFWLRYFSWATQHLCTVNYNLQTVLVLSHSIQTWAGHHGPTLITSKKKKKSAHTYTHTSSLSLNTIHIRIHRYFIYNIYMYTLTGTKMAVKNIHKMSVT